MGRSKHIDLVCVIAMIVALAVSIALIAGNLSLSEDTAEAAASSEQFTANDLNADWSTDSATTITLNGTTGKVVGNGAYIYNGNLYIVYAGSYVITGELTDGSIIVDADGDDDIYILLNGVSLNCEDSAAFLVENADNVYLTLAEGTENTMTSGDTYSESAEEDGINGTLFSRDDLTINGSGSLTVTGSYYHGIAAKDDLVITGGTITVTASEDGIHANDSVRIANADITIDAGDDGVTVSNDDASDYFYMESGTLTVNSCYEGVEAAAIYVNGGTITVYPTDDGFNSTSNSGDGIVINDGIITVINENGSDADGFDSNSSITINGGTVTINVPSNGSCALDYGSENNGTLTINGGTVFAAGSSMMLEEVSEESAQGFIVYTDSSFEAGSTLTLTDAEGNALISSDLQVGCSAVIISAAGMESGSSYTLTDGTTSAAVTAGENAASSGMGGGNMGGGGQMGGGRMENSDGSTDSSSSSEDGGMDQSEMTPPDGSDGEMPEDMELPEDMEDMEMPDMSDMELPDGADMSEMTPPGESAESDSGSSDSESADTDSADSDTAESDSSTADASGNEGMKGGMNRPGSTSDSSESEDGQMMEENNGQGQDHGSEEMREFGEDQEETETYDVGPATFVMIGVSVLILLIGLVIAWRFKGKI